MGVESVGGREERLLGGEESVDEEANEVKSVKVDIEEAYSENSVSADIEDAGDIEALKAFEISSRSVRVYREVSNGGKDDVQAWLSPEKAVRVDVGEAQDELLAPSSCETRSAGDDGIEVGV